MPPVAPGVAPPPPGYAPGPARPSAAGLFLGRVVRGDWAAAAKAALWPVLLLPALAAALAIPSYGQEDEVVVGWADRLRIALALLLQAVGGDFGIAASGSPFGGSYGSYGPNQDAGSGFGPGYGPGYGAGDAIAGGGAELSLVPLTVTLLWLGALCLGARMLRARGAGVDAAVRVAVLVAGSVLVLGLFAQPAILGIEVSSGPLSAALGALVLSFAVGAGVLRRDGLARWTEARPAAHSAVRALGTAVRAFAVVLALATPAGFATYAGADGVDGQALLIVLPILPNIGLTVLGLGWGAPVEYELRGRLGFFGSGAERGSFGLPELGEEFGGWAVTGAVALGVIAALTVGLWAARRSADRRGQLLTGGFFLALYLVAAGVSGVSARLAGSIDDFGGDGDVEAATDMAQALLFGLLWVGAAVLLAPYALKALGRNPGAPAPASAAFPAAPGAPAAPAVPVPPPGAAAAVPGPGAGKRKVLFWAGTLAAAFVIGGGATAGVLLLKDRGANGPAPDDRPAVAASRTPSGPADGPAATPVTGRSPSAEPGPTAGTGPTASAAPGGGPAVPDGYRMVADVAGFSFAVPEVWDRVKEEPQGQVTYAGSTGMAHFLVGVVPDAPYTSLENLTTLESNSRKKNVGYQRLRLEANTFQGRPGAIWEYTYKDGSGRTIHGIDQSYIAEDGTEYAIYFTAQEDGWEDAGETFDVAVSTWTLNDVD
ncbi:hypothetical protein [Streptomyces sp. SP18CS02]|uniref:hypothetical protein n=1 Tax=Streptomyces sp. SP18CS02 TaxID=3002531 RepID=UPI002E7A2059|nr:hypothetical protein [Streptomyces sp. SP18CS02]MEE1751823.1 hypothetical protein [Streptomyces sp. SP18CS02]